MAKTKQTEGEVKEKEKDDAPLNSRYVAAVEDWRDRLAERGVRMVSVENVLHIYQSGYWCLAEPTHYDELEPEFMASSLWAKLEWGKEYGALWRTAKTVLMRPGVRFDDVPLIAMPRGTLDPREDEPAVIPHDHAHYITRRIDTTYAPGAKCPEWEAMVLRMLEHPDRSPKDVEALARFLKQWVGINIVGPKAKANRQLQKGLIIEGLSGTGKTTFADVVRELFGGEKYVASPHMSELGETFGKAVLLNKQALISDDGIETQKEADPRVLKAIVTGEQMSVNRKHKDHIPFRFNGAVLFTSNTLPNFRDESAAIYNRFVVVRMDRVFTPAEQKAQLGGLKPVAFLRRKKEFPGILNWALDGFKEAYDQGHFSLPPEVKEAADVFRTRNDPVFGFVSECVKEGKQAVSARVLAAICAEYAAGAHNMTRMSHKTIHGQLQKVLREVYTGVKLETEGNVRNVTGYIDVALTDLGMAYWSKVQDKGVAGLEGLKTPYSKRV